MTYTRTFPDGCYYQTTGCVPAQISFVLDTTVVMLVHLARSGAGKILCIILVAFGYGGQNVTSVQVWPCSMILELTRDTGCP